MKVKVSLTMKVLFLVSAILASETFFVISINNLENQAEQVAKRALRSQRISDSINTLIRKIFELYAILENADVHDYDQIASTYKTKIQDFNKLLENLKLLAQDDPEQKRIVEESSIAMVKATRLLQKLRKGPRDESLWTTEYRAHRKALWKQLQIEINIAMSEELLSMNRAEKEIAEKSPEKMADFRRRMKYLLFGGLAANILLSVVLALYLVRAIVDRINILRENAIKLASDHPLLPRMHGNDEIARLDKWFHRMAASIEESNRKERAVLENARDMIFSVDARGRFTAINPASLSILGREPDELRGSYFIDMIHSDDTATVLDTIEKIKANQFNESFEARMAHKDGRTIHTSWSIQWSAHERSLFCVVHDITDRVELERLKQELMAMITHDLRTPLTSVMAFLEMLESGHLGDLTEDGSNLSAVAERNAKRMMSLINDLLDIEKIKSGMMELEKSDVDLDRLIEQAASLAEPIAKERRVKIRTKGNHLTVHADEEKISRVLQNLLANAIKFSGEDQRVEVSSKEENGAVEISVRDSGKGIPEEKLSGVFDRFLQAHSGEDKGGSGLGLAICKALVELHGGRIWVKSKEGEGATFTFSIPNSDHEKKT